MLFSVKREEQSNQVSIVSVTSGFVTHHKSVCNISWDMAMLVRECLISHADYSRIYRYMQKAGTFVPNLRPIYEFKFET